jgi:hypothetical protein
MTLHHLARRLVPSTAAVCLGAAVIASGVAPAATRSAGTTQITGSGVGAVKLGKTYTKLRKQKLVGKIRPGCELGGPNTRSAPLRSPLRGSVDFTLTSPRKVESITISRGATARGVGIGGTIADIEAAYPKAKVDHSTDETFALTLVNIPRSDGGRLSFGVDTTTEKITVIGVPFIAFCE